MPKNLHFAKILRIFAKNLEQTFSMSLQEYKDNGYKKDPYLYAYRKDFKKYTITVFSFQTIIQIGKTQITLDRVISPQSVELLAQTTYNIINEEVNQ